MYFKIDLGSHSRDEIKEKGFESHKKQDLEGLRAYSICTTNDIVRRMNNQMRMGFYTPKESSRPNMGGQGEDIRGRGEAGDERVPRYVRGL